MITQEDINRINELSHKSKREGLSNAEKREQADLRNAYIAAFRENLRSNLDHLDIQHPDGTIEHVADRRTSNRCKPTGGKRDDME